MIASHHLQGYAFISVPLDTVFTLFFGGRLRDFYGMVGIDASHLGPLRCLMGVSGF